jgi:hypothetical protein
MNLQFRQQTYKTIDAVDSISYTGDSIYYNEMKYYSF